MTTFDLGTVTIPAAAEYDEAAPQKNLENLAYVLLQIISIAKAADVKLGGSGNLMETIESFSASVLAAAGYES